MNRHEDVAATCDCGHPQGWHRKNVGSCIECACPYFDDRDEQATDRSAANTPARQAFKDCLRLRELAGRQTLTRKDNADLERIADRLHALAVMHERKEA